MNDQTDGWFSDIDETKDMWQPRLQAGGFCPCIDMWFQTKADCDEFIQDNIIGKGWDRADDPALVPPKAPRLISPEDYTIDRESAVTFTYPARRTLWARLTRK